MNIIIWINQLIIMNNKINMKKYNELIVGRRYYIEKNMNYRDGLEEFETIITEGIYASSTEYGIIMKNRIRKNNILEWLKRAPRYKNWRIEFYSKNDIYFDIEEIIENARNAILSFEQRSLNLILKRLVNEDFEWLLS